MIALENEYLKIEINEFGAELVSVIDKATGYEFLWQGNKKIWKGQAPVLFPIVGGLKNNQYRYRGKVYTMNRHGFARDMKFVTQAVTQSSATFYLKNNEETQRIYPFEFSFQITYILHENNISVSYEILNPSLTETLYYSVGGHPGFNVSQSSEGFIWEEVSVSLLPQGHYQQIPIKKGFINIEKAKFVEPTHIPLQTVSFKKDALIYRLAQDAYIKLSNPIDQIEIELIPRNFEFIGVWSAYPQGGKFVCLEPWAGIADLLDFEGELNEKLGMIALPPEAVKTHDYVIKFKKR